MAHPNTNLAATLLVAALFPACKGPLIDRGMPQETPSFDFARVDLPPAEAQFWAPTPETQGKYDWIKLKSGEWLKGDLAAMRDFELEFDSKELDEQEFDWEDVHEVRTTRPFTVRFEDDTTAQGPIWITDDKVHIAGESPVTLDRADIYSITPAGRELSHWRGKFSLSLSTESGNKDELDVFANGFLRRDDFKTRRRFDYSGQYSEIDGDKTDNKHRLSAKFDRYLSTKLYITPLSLDLFKDEFQNIDLRITPAMGVGYSFFREPKTKWDVEVSVGYQFITFSSVEPGEDDTKANGALGFGTHLEREFSKDVDFLIDYDLLASMDDFADNFHQMIATLSIDITDYVDLDISFIWGRVGSPQSIFGGDTPEKDDFHLTIGLGFEL